MKQAVVVGSGPNGLAAAVRLAQAGMAVTVLEGADSPGGGTRTSELTLPGVLHDDCSAFHPTGVLSPYLASLPLAEHGLEWTWPDIDLAHPLDDGRAGVLSRHMAATVASLGGDGRAWRRLFEPLVTGMGDLLEDVFGPIQHLPKHPVTLARFGLRAVLPASTLVRRFDDEPAKALFMGVAAHAFGRLDVPLSASVGLMLGAAGHRAGWPVAVGGSRSIAGSLVSLLTSLGGELRTGVPVTDLDQIADLVGHPPDVVLLDVAPRGAVQILGSLLPRRTRRSYDRFRYGPAVHKVDYAVRGDIGWTAPACRAAGTIHLGGSAAEIVEAERDTVAGVLPEHPFVLVGQQYLADPTRSVDGVNPIWAYAHVPHAYPGDATAAVTAQIERFAPGFGPQILATHTRGPAELEDYNPNYVGGDISAGANSGTQIVLRPRPAVDPYATGVPGVYLCSSSTPPGGGVHGMCGFHAAQSALRTMT